MRKFDDSDFDEFYFANCCGRPYKKDEVWTAFFERIANGVVKSIGPKRVLDAGCAMGFLVEALRQRGVEAYGFDISSYAIANVPHAVKDFCWQAKVSDEIEGRFDLIICQEVFAHVPLVDAEAAVGNFCRHANEIIFSSNPNYPPHPRHVNLQPPEHWEEVFARYGFYPVRSFDASFMTPWAVLFRLRNSPSLMQYRRIGQTDVHLSVVGFGTSQLQMIPERQAIATLRRGFELGINWVHTSPDYGGIEHWIAKAIKGFGKDIHVLSQGPAEASLFEPFFENTCRLFNKHRLEMYGINCIDDLEYQEKNVWGSHGMVEFLLKKKEEGRLGCIFCTTHGPSGYVSKLIESGVFDAVALAYNPLGFHELTYFAQRLNREYENLPENREKIFPLASKHNVSLLIMKPLAGGLLCRGKAFPPHVWFSSDDDTISASEILKYILSQPGVCAVMAGTACIEEAEENARAGYEPIERSESHKAAIENKAQKMRMALCNRCGQCEITCSQSLEISSIFRDYYIWNYRNELFMASDQENYFRLHPAEQLICLTCSEKTCRCPQGIDIPSALLQVHDRMHSLWKNGLHPGPPTKISERLIQGHHQMVILSKEVPQIVESGGTGICSIFVENVGDVMWTAFSHVPDYKIAVGVGVVMRGRLAWKIPIRQNVSPGQRSTLAFEFRVPRKPGEYKFQLYLLPLADRNVNKNATLFYSGLLTIENRQDYSSFNVLSELGIRFQHFIHGRLEDVRQIRANLRAVFKDKAQTILNKLRRNQRALEILLNLRRFIGPRPVNIDELKNDKSNLTSSYGIHYHQHTIPERLQTGVTYGVQISVENRGRSTWRANPSEGKPLYFIVLIDNRMFSVLKLPQSVVKPGDRVSIHFAIRAPDEEGKHNVRIEPVVSSLSWFFNQALAPLILKFEAYRRQTMESLELYDSAWRHNPWYYLPTQGIPESRDGRGFPLFVSRAKGCKIWDPEGREYIDYTMGWGSTILGYAEDRVQNAIRELLDVGPLPPFPHPVEMDVSRMLVEDFPCAEMVVFGKNGSDVCTVAARLARLTTGKGTILSCGFHGWQDFALDYLSFVDSGIPSGPKRFLYKFRFNDKEDFFRLYNLHKKDLAAVMIEPAGPWMSETEGLGPDADKEFLKTIAKAVKKAGALLIFDEIITCYRYPKGSVQSATGVVPDLACLGKALASGMPLAALVGTADIFHAGFSKTHYCPTFKGEIYSLAAAKAAIQIYREEEVAEHIWSYGEKLRSGIHALCHQYKISAECKGPPFRMGLLFKEKDPDIYRLKKTLYVQQLFKEGVVTVSGIMLPSYAHDEVVLEKTLSAIEKALGVMAEAEKKNDFNQYIEIPLL